ncbi:MAG: hypothetical protein KAI97_03520, partial [Gemmatimonadetes bacterium]|nr:hypothetical protein [Gemmatimonadota bacterium]
SDLVHVTDDTRLGVYPTVALLSGTVGHLGLLLALFLVGVTEKVIAEGKLPNNHGSSLASQNVSSLF